MLTVVILGAALVAGVTGAWSPCGFSMVETLAPAGYAGRLRTTVIACVTFSAGALVGGVVTFGGLSALGGALGATAPAVAAIIALAAALGEARGARIVPQVRRQVPESWRRVMPVPLAAGLYGVLLGLGFTTFILSFAVWALAGIAVALGDPHLGVLIGLGFGAGRAIPVVALAPHGGGALHAAMAERPKILRSLRALDALALAATAAALLAAPAHAQTTEAAVGYSDPSLDGPLIALHRPGGFGELRGPNGSVQTLPGTHPAVGGGRAAWIEGQTIVVQGVTTLPAPGADAVALSRDWVAWRAGQSLNAASLDPVSGFAQRVVLTGNVGRPALAFSTLVFDLDGRIESLDLVSGARVVLRRQARAQLRGPSILGFELAYVIATNRRQQVRVGPLRAQLPSSDPNLYGTTPTGRRDAGYEPGHEHAEGHSHQPLWESPPKGITDTLTTTALAANAVFVTRVRKTPGQPPQAAILRIDRLPQRARG